MEMQLNLAQSKADDEESEDRFMSTSTSLPSLGTMCVYDKAWNTVVGWGSHRQKAIQVSHGPPRFAFAVFFLL